MGDSQSILLPELNDLHPPVVHDNLTTGASSPLTPPQNLRGYCRTPPPLVQYQLPLDDWPLHPDRCTTRLQHYILVSAQAVRAQADQLTGEVTASTGSVA